MRHDNPNVGRALKLVEQLQKVRATTQLVRSYGDLENDGAPYDWQQEFHRAGNQNPERCILAGNRVGKTRTLSAECAIHATGWYPKWWTGKRFKKPTKGLVATTTNEMLRDPCQLLLMGGLEEQSREISGTGWIPKEAVGPATFRVCNVPGVVDTMKIKHVTGGWSTISFKSYEQGWMKYAGFEVDWAWLDEEPEDYRIFSEVQTRILTRNGILMVSMTPLFGKTELVEHFMDGDHGVYVVQATWGQAPHLNDDMRTHLLRSYRDHEIETRTKGVPMMGEGAVFPIRDSYITCEPFEVPKFFRQISGIDFGIDHPFGLVDLAYDADQDIVYVTNAQRVTGETPIYHCGMVPNNRRWVPVAYPHDGDTTEKGDGEQLIKKYRQHGLNALPFTARYDNKKGGTQPVEPIVDDMWERMKTSRFKVFSNQHLWLEEKRMYHRKDGKIQPVKDDLIAATRYALMMLRFATTHTQATNPMPAVTGGRDYSPIKAYQRRRRLAGAM